MKKYYRPLAKISLVGVFLVIIAGAVVRMTGSGMGCPDWPKCFGYYIPPTEKADLEWHPGRDYKKGQVIIWNETLLVATGDFSTTDVLVPAHWTPYTRHNYAVFNPFHTWTEFINRLFGALAGLCVFLLALASFGYRKARPGLTLLSCLVVVGMGFQAWLGATVVYSVLEPVKITVHMLVALGIVALLLYLLHTTGVRRNPVPVDLATRNLLILALVLTLVQVALGTQVRQFVDGQVEQVGEQEKNLWLQDAPWLFYLHRSFSVLLLLFNGYLAYRIKIRLLGLSGISWVVSLTALEALTGIAMYYLDFPFGTQPLHLLLATLLFGFQFYLVLEAIHTRTQLKTL